ncbi:MAG: response regulator, partial [Proteobacteria bacterium]|nr:response regulator [Pseudomonadota bacterium]
DRFQKLFDYAPLPYQSLDENGQIIEVNQIWLEILGYNREDVIGKSFGDFLHPEWVDHFKENFPKFKSMGEIMGIEFEMKKKDGSFISTRFDGRIRRNKAGDFIQTHCVFRDISLENSLKKRLRDQENAIRQSQKLEAIGNLAGGIAHDFNNILSSILGYTELALQDVQKQTDLHNNLTEVLRAGQRARKLVKQILTFSRKDEQEKAPVQINSMLADAVKMLRSTIPSSIEIKVQVCPEPIIINANTSQVNQIIINLVTNAAHAITDTGVIEIGLELTHLDENQAAQYPDLLPGKYADLFVSDTGCGIARENLACVFDPYFTTKTPDKGSGLGLSVVHGIVKIHGGHITVCSEETKGTTFHVYLPLSLHKPGKTEDKTKQPIEHGQENILFVDDEPVIGRLQKQLLERLGYHVVVKTSSKDALEFFTADPQSFQLVITDMTMPEMTGDKLSRAIKDIRPDIPIILCTGFSEKVNAQTAPDLPIDAFLMKPVETKKMAQTIRNLLDTKK